MNNTDRGLNRTLILVSGIVLLVLGVAAAALGSIESVRSGWADVAPTVHDNVAGLFASTPLGSTGASWMHVVVVALCVLAIVLLLVFVLRQGHGRTRELVNTAGTDSTGGVLVSSAIAEQSLQSALAARPELVSSSVTTYSVKRRPVLKISATARRGESPRAISEFVDGYLRSFDRLLGDEIPVLLHLSGGIRTRSAKASRVQ